MLKKMILVFLPVFVGLSFNVYSQNQPALPVKTKVSTDTLGDVTTVESYRIDDWASVQIGFWFNAPGNTEKVRVNGFRFGFPFCGTSPVSGLELSVLGASSVSLEGTQLSFGFCNTSTKSYGLQLAGGLCMNKGDFEGTQVSFFNMSEYSKGFQAGGVNLSNDIDGTQIGIANIAQRNEGFQAGVLNVVNRGRGTQIGLINYADRNDFQLGVLNFNNKSLMPFMFLFNCSK